MRNLADGNLFSGLSISKSGKRNMLTALWINFLHAGSSQVIYYLLWQINAKVANVPYYDSSNHKTCQTV